MPGAGQHSGTCHKAVLTLAVVDALLVGHDDVCALADRQWVPCYCMALPDDFVGQRAPILSWLRVLNSDADQADRSDQGVGLYQHNMRRSFGTALAHVTDCIDHSQTRPLSRSDRDNAGQSRFHNLRYRGMSDFRQIAQVLASERDDMEVLAVRMEVAEVLHTDLAGCTPLRPTLLLAVFGQECHGSTSATEKVD